MPTTNQPLIWDYYRKIDEASSLGGVVHYYDEWSQTIFLNNGLKTRLAEVPEGHWAESELNNIPIEINNQNYENLRFDHPSNGILYGITNNGNKLIYLRYIYGMDLSNYMSSWSWMSQTDNAISQFSGSVQNLGPDIFTTDLTLFQPGARIILKTMIGKSAPYPIGVAWLDECGYDILEDTVDITGRNSIGYFLKDQTFDDNNEWQQQASVTCKSILIYSGVKKYIVQTNTHVHKFEFDPSDTLLEGLEEICSYYNTKTQDWKIVELADGTICIGFEDWLSNHLPNTHYTFDEGEDIFKRKTTKLSDSSYTSLRVTGKGLDKKDLVPVTVSINNFQFWSLGAHRTQHLKAPDGLTQGGLQEWAETQAEKYQYIGIGEDFVGPFKPQLVVGDIAEVEQDGQGVALGVINEIRHSFSREDGFRTEFAVDSGGVVTDGSGYTIYSRAAEVSGFNRRQRIIDVVRYIAKK